MNLTKAQIQVYDMEKTIGGSIGNTCGIMLVNEPKESDVLRAAVNILYKKNDALRTRLFIENGRVSQCIQPYVPVEVEVLTFENKAQVHEYANAFARVPLDINGELVEIKGFRSKNFCGLLFKLHHIISDGWTASVLSTQFYKFLQGEDFKAYSYSEYVDTEKKYLDSNKHSDDVEFFTSLFKEKGEIVLFDETEAISKKSKRKTYILNKVFANRITAFANEHSLSPYSVFLSVVSLVYSMLKNSAENFYIGTIVLNRTNVAERNTVGMFVNTVPFLVDLKYDESFISNADRTAENVFSVFRHQKCNYVDVLKKIKDTNVSNKWFDVTFSFQVSAIKGENFESEWYCNGTQVETLQIHVDDYDCNDVFRLHYDYQIEKFSEEDIDDLHQRLIAILCDVIEHPDKPLYELSCISAEEKEKLLKTFNATEAEYRRDKCIHELIEEQVERTPEKVAVVATDKTLTYRELNEEANRIAHSLMEKGVGKGDIVGLMLPRRSYLLSALIGILKTGAAYLPIDSELPKERIEYMCKDTNAKMVVSEDNIAALMESENISNPDVEIDNNSLCYCIYTSGSTGQPKGVMAMHRNVVNYISKNEHNIFGKIVKEDFEAILSISTCSFDIFVTETIATLVNGLRVVLANEEECRNQYALNRLLTKEKGEFLQTTPTKLKVLIADPTQREFLNNLKAILLGGEAMETTFLKELKGMTKAKIYNIYGTTEVPIWSTFADTDSFVDEVTIGKPIANTQVYILDKYLKPVPIGVMGELCIAGDSVCAGYMNRAELTAEKFIDNPFGEGKMYRTGDNAYWREDGNIVYVGRSDFQVKIRGLRIELGEIESAIQAVEKIERAVVVVRKDKEGRQLICAFYTGEEKSAKEIREEIGKKLPRYMVPHIFTYLEKMPMTASGKANRNALPEIDLENISAQAEYVAPETEKEKILIDSIEEVLGGEKVSVADNFFDIGGDSLKAIELTAKLEGKGYTVSIKTIFASKDIRGLAGLLEEKESEYVPVEYGDRIPATAAQMRVYTAQMIKPDSAMYNVSYAFKVDEVNKERLEYAVNKLIARHESLRTHFENIEGTIYQVIDENADIKVEDIPEENLGAFVKPFELEKSPLMRVGCNNNTVVIDMHHIVVDGETMPVLFKELNELYMGRELPETTQYGEFAVEQTDAQSSEKYWLETFAEEVPTLELPVDYPRGAIQSFEGSVHYEIIEKSLHERIEEKCKDRGITPYVYYMACYSILLSKLSGSEDITVGTPISGRKSRYLNTVGMFVNTIALRNKPEGNKKIAELLREIRDNSIEAIANQNYPFGELVKKLSIEVGGRNPLFDVMLAYQSFEMTDITFNDRKVELIPLVTKAAKCDMSFSVLPRKTDVVLAVEYCTKLFKEEKISRFTKMYLDLLELCLNDEEYIKDVSVTDVELLETFNRTEYTYKIPEESTLYSLFEKTSEENKDKVCIKANDEEITFADFKKYAEKIDSRVREITKQEKTVIAVICERSFEMYGAVYGIIRGGNAYLPIDPNYPQDRIDYILENSNAKAVIVQDKFCGLAGKVPCIDATAVFDSNEEVEETKVLALPEDTAYVIYTSGSTGNPKGAKISHKSAINRILWMDDFYPLEEDDVILQKTPYTFDVSVWELFWWGITGRVLCASKPDEHFLPAKILEETEKNKVTHLHFVPSVFDLFLTYLENNPEEQDKFNSVKYVFLSGEALTANHIKRFYNTYDYNKVKLHNLYGPTECAVDVSYYACTPTDVDPVPIGKPIYNTQLYIVDKYLNPTPIGVIGELCIAGVNVGQGYLNSPELTAEKFIDNPFGEGKLYKTGDLAYWRDDGNIVFCGRIDGQVKLNGQRVEIGEIESVINDINGVSSVAVIVKKINNRDILVAFYSGEKDCNEAIKDICADKLPKYMVPGVIQRLEEMPLNPSGKLDRKALSQLEVEIITSAENEVPQNDLESFICNSFERVLNLKNIGRNSDFFEFGGTSLSMITLLSEKEFENITAAEFMRNSTPAKLAITMGKKQEEIMFDYLEPLYVPSNAKNSLILLPFAGGGAESYSNFVSSMKRRRDDIAIYFIPYLHSMEECDDVVEEINKNLNNTDIFVYSHCVGSALALKLLGMLEKAGVKIVHYFAGASIPPEKTTSKNIWNNVPDNVLKRILLKAGAEFSGLSDEKITEKLKKFRKDTDFANICFTEINGKVNTPVSVIISKKDMFTRNYKKCKKLWGIYAENIDSVHFIDANTHYFQRNNSNELVEWILSIE